MARRDDCGTRVSVFRASMRSKHSMECSDKQRTLPTHPRRWVLEIYFLSYPHRMLHRLVLSLILGIIEGKDFHHVARVWHGRFIDV
jgi:hypothetical protein